MQSLFDQILRMGESGAMSPGLQGRAAREARRFAWVVLLLVAVVVRAAIPAGWMPKLDGAQGGELVICTGGGQVVLHGKDGPPSPHRSGHHEVCAYASPGSAPTAEAPVLHTPTGFELTSTEATAPEGVQPSAPRHRDQAARAPPRLI